ncbi:MAG TPA: hypothetical protein VK883_08125 [Arthrobacter sp.]|nr:hypothetical protein [Arthrobacter sp.]
MTVDVAQQVTSCGELSVGDKIEAWHNGKLFHRGEVIRTVAATDLFWILDERTGTRRLIDAEVLVIRRVAVPAVRYGSAATCDSATDRGSAAAHAAAQGSTAVHSPAVTERSVDAGRASGRPASEAPAPVVPASHVPLFQAPSLAG